MGQSLSKTVWTTNAASSKDSRMNDDLVGEYQLKKTFDVVNKSSSREIQERNVLSTTTEASNADTTKLNSLNRNNTTSKILSSTASSLASSPSNQVIIRIKLTKMENNSSNHPESLEDICPATPEMATLASINNSSAFGSTSSEMIPSLDNNLNITCGTNSIINLTISNNFVCDSPLNTSTSTAALTSSPNNLNIVNSHDSNSNTIHCLNIIDDDNIENDLNQPRINEMVDSNARSDNARMQNLPQNISSLSSSIGGCPATTDGMSCMDGVQCSCSSSSGSSGNIPNQMQKTVELECNSGHSSLCAQSNIDGNGRHCCRSTKKISSAYPSKLRCCQCIRVESHASNNNNNHNSSEAGTSSMQNNFRAKGCNRYRNNFNMNHSSCRNSVNLIPSTINSNRPNSVGDTTGSASRQIFHPNIHQHNVIVLSVNPSVQSIIVDPQQNSHLLPHLHHSHPTVGHHPSIALGGASDLRWLLQPGGPVLCTSTAQNGTAPGKSGISNIATPMVHSQADYRHCLVPDLEKIFSSSFYWGKMDRYEAERLLEGKPEGTFLLRDSAQEEYLFSVTFRKYGRSLHARIEQLGHKFSFDCHDPGVYTASTVTGLLEHYKDPSCVMFFEPMLTIPLHRNFSFSLQQLCRATIVSHITYDGINELQLPTSLKAYLKEYHYKYKVRETPLDDSLYPCS